MNNIGLTISTLGEIMVAYTVVRVHYRFWKEHKVDDEVFSAMRREQRVASLGIILIIVGFLVQVMN